MNYRDQAQIFADIERRLARMETRIVKLMLHFNMDPYDTAKHPIQPAPAKDHAAPAGKPVSSWWRSLSR